MGRKRIRQPGVDCRTRILAFDALGFESEIDHHDGVLLHHAHQHDQAHERVEVQFLVKQRQRQQRAKHGRRKSGKNGDGMNKALIQNAQDDVDHQNRDDQQNGQASEGPLEFLHGSLKIHAQVCGMCISRTTAFSLSAAWPSETPGARLKETVTEGSWPK